MLRRSEHSFGTLKNPVPLQQKNLFEKLSPTWKQVHGNQIAWVESPNQNCGEVDALVTCNPGLFVSVVTADCVPIIIKEKSGLAVAAIHAGWRGCISHITESVFNFLKKELSISASQCVATIGPSIRACCYEVSEEMILNFSREFSKFSQASYVPQFRRLDLAHLQKNIIADLGCSDIDVVNECTYCAKDEDGEFKYFSFRRSTHKSQNNAGGRQWSIAWISQ